MRQVTCECCAGSGMRRLTQIENDTLSAVDVEWRTTAEIGKAIPKAHRPSHTALCNRLVSLEEIGLVERSPRHRQSNRWRLCATQDKQWRETVRHADALTEMSDEEVDHEIRAAGGDPAAIGRRGKALVDRILADRKASR